MAAQPTPLVPVEEYLSTSYQPECEYLDGVLVQKSMGQFDHARLQTIVSAMFFNHEHEWNVMVLNEQPTKISPSRYRVPDLVIVPDSYDRSPVVADPLLCIEILSPDDTISGMEKRWLDALAAGAEAVWIFDPEGAIYLADARGFRQLPAGATELTLGSIRFDIAEMRKLQER